MNKPEQLTFAGIAGASVILCPRCDILIRADATPGSSAKMLKRSKNTDGLCVNCALHDWLRNTYPVNLHFAEHGPSALEHTHVRKQIEQIMRVGKADASPDEINWDRIVENWKLPFPRPVKRTATNPVSQKELEEIARGEREPWGPSQSKSQSGSDGG